MDDCSHSPPLIGLTSPSATAHRLLPVQLDATHQSVDLQVAGSQAERCGCW